MKVLFIKLTSMGDVIHAMPAVTQALSQRKDIQIDWLVDTSIREIPEWHKQINQVYSIPIRQFRQNIKQIFKIIYKLRLKKYDLIIDAQGLLKTMVLASTLNSKSYGYDASSLREPLAAYGYSQIIKVAKQQHAIDKINELLASVLNYSLIKNSYYDFGVDWTQFNQIPISQPYVAMFHGTSWVNKHWPDKHWIELIRATYRQGLFATMTWSNSEQRNRVESIARQVSHKNLIVLPNMSLTQAAHWIYGSQWTVGVDTGFGHLAAAMGKKHIGIYGPTSVQLTGTKGMLTRDVFSNFDCSPCLKKFCALDIGATFPPCMQAIQPQEIIELIYKKI